MKIEPSRNPKALVLRFSSLGDVVLAFPFLDALGKQDPSWRVTFAVKPQYAKLLEAHPTVEEVVPWSWRRFFELRRRLHSGEFTAVFDLHGSLRSRLIEVFCRPRGLPWFQVDAQRARREAVVRLKKNAPPADPVVVRYLRVLQDFGLHLSEKTPVLNVPVSVTEKAFLRGVLQTQNITADRWVVGMAPASRWPTKEWPPEFFAELAARLVAKRKVVLWWFGAPQEGARIRAIQRKSGLTGKEQGMNWAGRLSLTQTAALLGRCDIVVSNDSGLMHLAAGRGCRVVAIFGSTTPALGFAPWTKRAVIVEDPSVPCRPCHIHGRRHCPLGHFQCMRHLTVDIVEQAVSAAFRREK